VKTQSFLRLGLDVALPRYCVLCGDSMLDGAIPWPLCPDCASHLEPWPGERCPVCGILLISEQGPCMRCRGVQRAFASAYPLFSYSGAVRELVSAYKKGRRPSLAPFFASLLGPVIKARWPERILVPVPPRPGKLRVQGWDQVEAIAAILEAQGFPVERPLERRRSKEQKTLDRGGRGANARKAYSLRPGARSPALPLILDDVVTTCATLEACAQALEEGGASSVEAVAIAAD
jgi:competence protein ComFC